MPFYKRADVEQVIKQLNDENINYVLIKNIRNELPDCLEKDKDIDLLVYKKDWERFKKFIRKIKAIEILHPWGRWKGYSTLYGVDYPHIYVLKSGIMLDVSNDLCVKSLDMPSWIPLDASINASIWTDKVWNEELQCWQMDEKNLFCYLIARGVFDKRGFSEAYQEEISRRKELLHEPVVIQKLNGIFFAFTSELKRLIEAGDYDHIIQRYISYMEY